jgi:hypothetical protein
MDEYNNFDDISQLVNDQIDNEVSIDLNPS